VQQLVPGLGEGLRELVGVLQEAARDRLVDRVEPQRQVGGEHRRLALRRVRRRAGHDRLGVLGDPLVGAGGALGELPLVAEEDLEEAVVPLVRGVGPGDLQAGGDRVGALAGAVRRPPTQALLLDRRALGLGADQVGVAGAVGLAERVTAGDERDGLLVVHRHPGERLADVAGGRQGVRVAVRALGVDVDQAHLDRAERVGELPLTAVPLVAEPGVLGAPEDLLRLPDVLATEREAEGLEAHVLERDVAREHEQVGPGDLLAVLLLDRPQQPARLVEVGVVRPAVERGEALGAVAGAAPAVVDAVGPGRVPAEPVHQAAVVPVVGRPPVLGVAQHGRHVPLELLDVDLRELGRVVEVGTERVARRRVGVQDGQVEVVGPPVLERVRTTAGLGLRRRDARVLALAASLADSAVVHDGATALGLAVDALWALVLGHVASFQVR